MITKNELELRCLIDFGSSVIKKIYYAFRKTTKLQGGMICQNINYKSSKWWTIHAAVFTGSLSSHLWQTGAFA